MAFGSAGPLAKALIHTGWTAGAAVLVRLAGAAAILAVGPRRTAWPVCADRRSEARTVTLYGVVAMAGTQLAFINAVRTLDVGVALLLEFLAPVQLLMWSSLRDRAWPPLSVLAGGTATLVGLVLMLKLWIVDQVDPAGVMWGLLAALFLSTFFVMSARQDSGLPPLFMAAGGTLVVAVVLAGAGLVGLVPIAFATSDAVLMGTPMTWIVPASGLVLIATVAAYLTGIGAIVRLGTRAASFVALTEVLFAILLAWALLAELPGLAHLVGGICIVGGIVVIQRSPGLTGADEPPTVVEAVHSV